MAIDRPPSLPVTAPLPALGEACVHLWWIDGGPRHPRARRARIDRLLREVLSRYAGVAPQALRFDRESRGRPFLRDPGGAASGPDFNLSDTTGGTLVSVAGSGLRIGVDMERSDRQLAHRALAPRYFSAAEANALAALQDDDARHAFLALWTAKEAACKATGTGIYGWLDRWCFVVAGGDPQLQAAPADAGAHAHWRFERLVPAPQYTAVLACHGAPGMLARLQLSAFALPPID